MYSDDMNGKEVQKGGIYAYICLIHFTTVETNTTLQSNYSPVKINFSKKSHLFFSLHQAHHQLHSSYGRPGQLDQLLNNHLLLTYYVQFHISGIKQNILYGYVSGYQPNISSSQYLPPPSHPPFNQSYKQLQPVYHCLREMILEQKEKKKQSFPCFCVP